MTIPAEVGRDLDRTVQASRCEERFETMDRNLCDPGNLSEEAVAQCAARRFGLPYADPTIVDEVDVVSLRAAGIGVVPEASFMPLGIDASGTLRIALAMAEALPAADKAYSAFGTLQYLAASPATVRAVYCRHFAQIDERLRAAIEAAEAVGGVDRRLLGTLLRHACFCGASSLRLYSTLHRGAVNLRIDGAGREVAELSRPLFDALWGLAAADARIRAEAAVDRLVEGGITFRDDPASRAEFADLFDRYSFRLHLGAGARGGRSAVVRLRDSQAAGMPLDRLGFEASDLAAIRRALRELHGLVLLVGPADSGRTTSLYAMLETIDPERHSIQTIENPVERRYGKWLQYEVGAEAGRGGRDGFSDRFRQLLRNRPDVVMLGEIRSPETARLTVQAMQAGCSVFSTLHADRARHVFAGFRDMGVEPADLASCLSLVVAQRLVRKLCRACAVPDESEELRGIFARAGNSWWPASDSREPLRARRANPRGCGNCGGTGYRGRAMIYEWMEVDAGVRSLVEDPVGAAEMEQRLFSEGRGIWDQGLRLVARGITSLDALRASIREPR